MSKRQNKNSRKADPGTLDEFVRFIAPNLSLEINNPPCWPPDVFAIAASVLNHTGAYRCVIDYWPPEKTSLQEWTTSMRAVGLSWRKTCLPGRRNPPPAEIGKWWNIVIENIYEALQIVSTDIQLCHSLLQLIAAADEACAGIGIPPIDDRFDERASLLLLSPSSTLCTGIIDDRKIKVFPKLHAPANGLTIRSLSHNLALIPMKEVKPIWRQGFFREDADSLNILIVPWPSELSVEQFCPSPAERYKSAALPKEYGIFRYIPKTSTRGLALKLKSVLERARRVASIDVIVFPELAHTPQQHKIIRDTLLQTSTDTMLLISGVCAPPKKPSQSAKNYVEINLLYDGRGYTQFIQCKHHRWRLDRNQIIQYGLSGRLSPARSWWEDCGSDNREISFLSCSPWFTMCSLVCEDLARQDPVAEIVRAVGPNLLVALLMDGPQLASRWASRYATVLADDPGTSVLTVTCTGMVELSNPPLGVAPSRTIGLWKDAKAARPIPIDLPNNSDAIILTLAGDFFGEYSADGRHDDYASAYPVLAGILPVRCGSGA